MSEEQKTQKGGKYVAASTMRVVLRKAILDTTRGGRVTEKGSPSIFYTFERGQVVTGKHSTLDTCGIYTAARICSDLKDRYRKDVVTVDEVEEILAEMAKNPRNRLLTETEWIAKFRGPDAVSSKKRIESLTSEVSELRKQLEAAEAKAEKTGTGKAADDGKKGK